MSPLRRRCHDGDVANGAVSGELERLLLEPARARRWLPYVQRRRRPGVHQGAVAQVLAEHLWSSGEVAEEDTSLPRRLKDLVSRALGGRGISDRGLQLFVDAFDLGESDAALLWALRSGASRRGTPRGSAAAASAGPRDHQTIALHELHTIGADGLPEQHRTVQVIRALRDMTSYEYRIDTAAAAVEVVRGGRAGPLVDSGVPGVSSCRIELSSPLRPGEIAGLEYRTVFAYPTPPSKEFRRGSRLPVTNVALVLVFHPDALPDVVEWCRWDLLGDGEPTAVERVELGPQHSVGRFLDVLVDELRGYRWR